MTNEKNNQFKGLLVIAGGLLLLANVGLIQKPLENINLFGRFSPLDSVKLEDKEDEFYNIKRTGFYWNDNETIDQISEDYICKEKPKFLEGVDIVDYIIPKSSEFSIHNPEYYEKKR